MKVLMLGWEYPPHITGGLGTACQGLTIALGKMGTEIDFVVPHLLGGERAPHMKLIESTRGLACAELGLEPLEEDANDGFPVTGKITRYEVPAVLSPYWNEVSYITYVEKLKRLSPDEIESLLPNELFPDGDRRRSAIFSPSFKGGYGGDLFKEIELFARNVLRLVGHRRFDVIHAHDWITFPAGIALAQASQKPLVVHVHSLEADRAGASGNPRIRAIESKGIRVANSVIAVSNYTASVIAREYGVSRSNITVVHNGMEVPPPLHSKVLNKEGIKGKIVLFLGRITYQKGPEYFVEAASRVLAKHPNTIFVMAGSGDMLPQMISRARELGILENFRFTGFLKGREVEEMFTAADLYVMPSVSEPFGLTALEAIHCGTPVIVSKTSGVSEVLNHVMKVDFWDVEKMASLIAEAISDDAVGRNIVASSQNDIARLRWDAAARIVLEVYGAVVPAPAVPTPAVPTPAVAAPKGLPTKRALSLGAS
jgi:glycosyltransferase involved in cell wall biosynthesis